MSVDRSTGTSWYNFVDAAERGNEEVIRQSLTALKELNLAHVAISWLMEKLKASFQSVISEYLQYWDGFQEQRTKASSPEELYPYAHEQVTKAIEFLYTKYSDQCHTLRCIDTIFHQQLCQTFAFEVQAIVSCKQPDHYTEMLELYFGNAFTVFSNQVRANLQEGPPSPYEENMLQVVGTVEQFQTTCGFMQQLQMAPQCVDLCMHRLFQQISNKIHSSCVGDYAHTHTLARIEDWLVTVGLPFVGEFFSYCGKPPANSAPYHQWKTRIEYYVYHTYASQSITDFFDMVADWPTSLPAFEDLRQCISMTAQHPQLIQSARAQIRRRLLLLGAKTSDIIRFMIHTYKVVGVLYQHVGSIVDTICEDLKNYLKQRKDTVRCIVLGLINDPESDLSDLLYAELQKSTSDNTLTVYYSSDEDDTVDVTKCKPSPLRTASDPKGSDMFEVMGVGPQQTGIIKTLVSIFGHTDLFIREYCSILCDRLLSTVTYEVSNELLILELLKLRFGETALQSCEVMLKDMADSKRINSHLTDAAHHPTKGRLVSNSPSGHITVDECHVSAAIISSLYWPLPQDSLETYEPHPFVKQLQAAYTAKYTKLKAPRVLRWLQGINMGMMNVSLEFSNNSDIAQHNNYHVTPLQGSIILHFTERDEWKSTQLADVLKISTQALHKRIQFWVANQIIVAEGDLPDTVYKLVDDNTLLDPTSQQSAMVHDDDEEEVDTKDEDNDFDWSVASQFVTGMLTNLAPCKLSTMHTQLQYLITGYNRTEHQLADYLQKLVQEDTIVHNPDADTYAAKGK